MCKDQKRVRHPSPPPSPQPRVVSKSNRLLLLLIVIGLCVETILHIFTYTNENGEHLLSFIYDGSYSMIRLCPLQQRPSSHWKKYSTIYTNLPETNRLVFDVISIGTLIKPELQDAQMTTFGSHPAIRNFYRINELNDTDPTCSTQLTMKDFWSIHHKCTRTDDQQSYITKLYQQDVTFKPKLSTGWLCAQKRPIDGLYSALHRFLKRDGNSSSTSNVTEATIPNYLFIIDDDTYINMNYMLETLPFEFPYNETYLLTGCLLKNPKTITLMFPFGGYGSILSRKTIERLVQPIYCSSSSSSNNTSNTERMIMTPDDRFNDKACWRLQQNLIGEQPYFRDGMSVLELMYAFSTNLPYTRYNEWGDYNDNNAKTTMDGASSSGGTSGSGTSFCFHSDHSLGYFFGFYHIGVPDQVWLDSTTVLDEYSYHQQPEPIEYHKKGDTLRLRYSYQELKIPGRATCVSHIGRRNAKRGKCNVGIDPFCHNVDVMQMNDLYNG